MPNFLSTNGETSIKQANSIKHQEAKKKSQKKKLFQKQKLTPSTTTSAIMDSGMVRLKESVATKEEVKKQPLQSDSP